MYASLAPPPRARLCLTRAQAIGFTSTTGMRGTVDLFVGDRVATPPDSAAAAFSERLVLLPRSYFVAAHREQFGDIERALPAAPVRAWLASWATAVADAAPAGNTTGTLPVAHARQAVRRALFAQAGLEHAAPAVACSFNQAYKVSPRAFDAWMRVLDAAPHAVLWLLEFPREASDRLRARAPVHLARRIVATPRLPLAQHVALKGACDLHLDGHPYGAHITAADALYAGVPVLTRTARTFSGRVASSLLVHADPSAAATLVCASWACFESRGARLLASAELPALRAQLAHAVRTSPRSLFAAPAYARDTYAWLAMAVDLRAARRTAGHFVVCS